MVSHLIRLICRRKLHGLVRYGELRVHSHHSGKHIRIILQGIPDKFSILHHCFSCLIHPVPVGDLITQTRPYSQFLRRIRYSKQAVFDMPKACMMVKDSRHTISDTGNHGIHRAVFRLLKRQLPVNGPPLSVQDIKKALRIIAFDTKHCKCARGY